mgnify:CR=1 FL=1
MASDQRVTDEQAAVFAAYHTDDSLPWYQADPSLLKQRGDDAEEFPYDKERDEFVWLRDLALDLLSARESLAASQCALAEAIADARLMMAERDAPEGLRDQLGGAERRIVELTQERDVLRAERNTEHLYRQQAERERDEARANAAALLSRAAKCPLSLSHEWSCPLLEPSRLRDANEEAGRG